MKRNLKAIVIAMLACAAFVACSDDSDDVDVDVDVETDTETETGVLPSGSDLAGYITSDTTLEEDGRYYLTGKLHVQAGATLIIEPGVTIVSDVESDGSSDMVSSADMRYIMIERGAKIDAQGSTLKPITMTSVSKVPGAWGGVHICGYASTNTGADSESEIGGCLYGGSDDSDNSGILSYVIVEYTGQSLSDEQECNGISFYGVGNGTTVSNVSALYGTDDGFEFFGGTVDIKHCLVVDCEDDSFDWTDGWRGRGQFLVAYHSVADKFDCLMECDTNGDNNIATPLSKPVFSNVTLVGKDKSGKDTGVMLKAGTLIELNNTIITGKTKAITIKTDATHDALVDGSSVLSSVYTFSTTAIDNLVDATSGYSDADFTAAGNVICDALELDGYIGTVADATVTAMTDSFFEATDYVGAVKDAASDWTVYLK